MEGRLGRDSGLTGIKSLAFPAFTCTTMDDSLSRIEELGEVTEVTELPLIGRNPRPDHPRLARDFIRSHHPRKILMQGICGFLDSGVFMHLSSIHSPRALSCSKYSAVASTTAGGGTNPCRCHLRAPSIIHAKIPGHSALSFSGSSGSGTAGDAGRAPPGAAAACQRRCASVAGGSLQ